MKELRCIVFNEQEVANAILDRRRRQREPVPAGQIAGVTYKMGEAFTVSLYLLQDNGALEQEVVRGDEVLAAMIAFCMGRRIPLPVAAEKFLFLVNNALTLMITINFNRAPRLVPAHSNDHVRVRHVRRPVV
jgi:hypothetical protein